MRLSPMPVPGKAPHLLRPIGHRLKKKGGRLPVVLLYQAAVGQHRGQLVCHDALVQWDQVALCNEQDGHEV